MAMVYSPAAAGWIDNDAKTINSGRTIGTTPVCTAGGISGYSYRVTEARTSRQRKLTGFKSNRTDL
jgi:hypothetical protein